MRILVVYYSRSGHTRRLAERLARELGADLAAIRERGTRQGLLAYPRALIEAVAGLDARIVVPPAVTAYDLVVIGTPIWGWHLSSPVRAWARQRSGAVRRAAFFCTADHGGTRAAFEELEALLRRKPKATLAMTAAEVDRLIDGRAQARIDRFVAALRALAAPLPAPAERLAA